MQVSVKLDRNINSCGDDGDDGGGGEADGGTVLDGDKAGHGDVGGDEHGDDGHIAGDGECGGMAMVGGVFQLAEEMTSLRFNPFPMKRSQEDVSIFLEARCFIIGL